MLDLNNLEEFTEYLSMRDDCIKNSMQSMLLNEYYSDYPLQAVIDICNVVKVNPETLSTTKKINMIKSTLKYHENNSIFWSNCAKQIEDQAFIKLTAKLLSNKTLIIN